jgi:signal transduction histidine kinase
VRWVQTWNRCLLWFVPPSLRDADADTLRRAKLCVGYAFTVPVWGPILAWLLWWIGQNAVAGAIAMATACTIAPLLLLRTTGSLALTAHVIAGATAAFTILCSWLEGGLAAPGLLWFPLAPVLATLIGGRRAGAGWAGVMIAGLVFFYVMEIQGLAPTFRVSGLNLALVRVTLATAAIVLFAGVAFLFESLKSDALTSLQAANRDLERARDEAQAATRAKSDFLATMSHEVRTPLHGIFGMTELALDTTDDADRREFILRARACGETLLTLIDDILDFSRIEAGRLGLERTPFDVRAILGDVLDTVAVDASQRGIEVIGCVEEEVPDRLVGDPARLRQIVVNLAANAVKFTAAGEVVIAIGAQALPDDRARLTVRVRDTGIGMDAETQAHIFEAFTQGDGSTTRRYGGTGLGLAIVQRLVRLMDGEIAVTSEPGAGSIFTLAIPLSIADSVRVEAAPILAGVRVLVIDAHAGSRAHLGHVLAHRGCAVGQAESIDGACTWLATSGARTVDAIVLALPDEPAAAVERLRAAAPHAEVVALAMSTQRAGREALHVVATVEKPVKTEPLVAAVAAAARRAHGHRAHDARVA